MLLAAVLAGGMTQVVSPVAAATVVSEDHVNAALVVIWRGTPGWFARAPHSETGGGSGRTYQTSIAYGDIRLDLRFDFATRVATVMGHRVALGDRNVVLIDGIDRHGATTVVRVLPVDGRLPSSYPDIFPLLARSPAVVAFLACDTKYDADPLAALSDWCAPLFNAGAVPATPELEVRAALARYVDLARHMDHAGVAAMFAPDGEIVNPGQATVRGPTAVEAFLRGFDAYRVTFYLMAAERTVVDGDRARQSGRFRQIVTTPDGTQVRPSGTFSIDWVRTAPGTWRIQRAATTPDR